MRRTAEVCRESGKFSAMERKRVRNLRRVFCTIETLNFQGFIKVLKMNSAWSKRLFDTLKSLILKYQRLLFYFRSTAQSLVAQYFAAIGCIASNQK